MFKKFAVTRSAGVFLIWGFMAREDMGNGIGVLSRRRRREPSLGTGRGGLCVNMSYETDRCMPTGSWTRLPLFSAVSFLESSLMSVFRSRALICLQLTVDKMQIGDICWPVMVAPGSSSLILPVHTPSHPVLFHNSFVETYLPHS